MYEMSLRASTDSVDFRGEITEAVVDFDLDFRAPDASTKTIEFSDYANDATFLVFDPRGDGREFLPVTAGTFAYRITQPGVYRPTVQTGTCRQALLLARAAVVARRSFAPLLKVETQPELALGVNVGQTVTVIFSVADRDGSQLFDLTFDPDGVAGPVEPVRKPLWDISIEPTFTAQFAYDDPGLVVFEAHVADEQFDETIYEQPAPVGLVGLFDGLVQNSVSVSNIRALSGYAAEDSATVWAVASGVGGLRMYAYDPNDGAIHIRGQLAGDGPGALSILDVLFEPISRLGWVAVSEQGLYAVDLTDLTSASFREPYTRHYPVYDANVQRQYELAYGFNSGGFRFGVVANNAAGELHLLRMAPSQLDVQRASADDFDETAICQITDAKLVGIRQCDCADPFEACDRSRYAERLDVGSVKDVAWMPPYLAVVGDSQIVRVLDASDAVTGPKLLTDDYGMSVAGSFSTPAIHSASETNYGTSVTGRSNPSDPNRIDWFVAHNDHGLAFGYTDTTAQVTDIYEGPHANFNAERRAGVIQTTVGYDTFGSVRWTNDQVVVADQFGETRSALLVLDPDNWFDRDATAGDFEYEYSQKCIESEIWGAPIGGLPITYITDCIPMVPEKLDVAGTYVGAVGGDRLYVASIGPLPSSYDYSSTFSTLAAGEVLASLSLNGQITDIRSAGQRVFVARSLGGVEVWDLSATNAEQRLLPRIIDGLGTGMVAQAIWPVSEDAFWLTDYESLAYLEVGVSGSFSATALTTVVLPEPYSKMFFDQDAPRFYGLARDGGTIDVVAGTGLRLGTTVDGGYADLSMSAAGQVVAQRYTQNGAIAYEWLDQDAVVESLLQRSADRVQRFIAHGSDTLYIVETVFDGTLDSSTLRVFERNGSSVAQTHELALPVANTYPLTGIRLEMVGQYLAILFQGSNRGIYLFDTSDAAAAPEFVASSLRADLGLMDLFHPMWLGSDIAIVGAANGGFHAGKLDFVRFLLTP